MVLYRLATQVAYSEYSSEKMDPDVGNYRRSNNVFNPIFRCEANVCFAFDLKQIGVPPITNVFVF
jgi:hypothetical protein